MQVRLANMSKQLSWVGVLLIATISGLLVRILGDPLVELTSPKIENFFESAEEFWDDPQDWIEEWREDWRD